MATVQFHHAFAPAPTGQQPCQLSAPSVSIDGVPYTLTSTPTVTCNCDPHLRPAVNSKWLSTRLTTTLDADYDFHAYIAMSGEPRVSVNWNDPSKLVDLDQVIAEPVNCVSRFLLPVSPSKR